MKAIPSAPEVVREAIIVVAGALLAAFIVGRLPQVRDYIKNQWDGAPRL